MRNGRIKFIMHHKSVGNWNLLFCCYATKRHELSLLNAEKYELSNIRLLTKRLLVNLTRLLTQQQNASAFLELTHVQVGL
jgi:hypothetical protein